MELAPVDAVALGRLPHGTDISVSSPPLARHWTPIARIVGETMAIACSISGNFARHD